MTDNEMALLAYLCMVQTKAGKACIFDYNRSQLCTYLLRSTDRGDWWIYDLQRKSIVTGRSSIFFDAQSGSTFNISFKKDYFKVSCLQSECHYYGSVFDGIVSIVDNRLRREMKYRVIE